ncbi:hypothetical protein FH972_022037 [Carpinus fangiana]|uniref:Uncharacterized protein n=1 Tax=Carpinus fangiana TaxID=176857 RepID=A0A5N6KT96_9ROSI|nr:hypothetical protein FH972_022037 [Carpinus fangiana]
MRNLGFEVLIQVSSVFLGRPRTPDERKPAHTLKIVILILVFLSAALYYSYSGTSDLSILPTSSPSVPDPPPTVNLVVASVKDEDTSWVTTHFPEYGSTVYKADDPAAQYTVPRNKGREAAVFLTYIIDHYSTLPDISFFLHGKRYQWHNEDPLYDGVQVLKQFQLPYALREGFATLRCTWEFGCPSELRLNTSRSEEEIKAILADPKDSTEKIDDRGKTEAVYPRAFAELFGPSAALPKTIAVHCGAQFAVAADTIRKRPQQDYIHFRDWLWNTDLGDDLSGRVMEYTWHIMFGKDTVLCPHAKICFCEKFGLCDLSNCKEWGCDKRFWVHFGVLPDGWPDFGTGENGWPPRDWAD